MDTHTHTYTHTYIYIYIYVYKHPLPQLACQAAGTVSATSDGAGGSGATGLDAIPTGPGTLLKMLAKRIGSNQKKERQRGGQERER